MGIGERDANWFQSNMPYSEPEKMNKPEESGEEKQLGLSEFEEVIIKESEEEAPEESKENHEQFLQRLECFGEIEKKLIDFAYDLGKAGHRNQWRESGIRYFEHLRATALILLDEIEIRDADMICAALLHDAGEDTPVFGNITKSYDDWFETSMFRLSRVFNERAARMVVALTKPYLDQIRFTNKAEAAEFYHHNLENASPETILVKMADRLHNLRTLDASTPEKQIKQIKETREIYFPLFEKVLEKYPKEGRILLDKMEEAISKIEASRA